MKSKFCQRKKIILITLTVILTAISEINCQTQGRINLPDHSFAIGLIETSPDKFISNPAKLKFIDSNQIGLSISPSMFGLKELNSGNVFYNHKINEQFIVGSTIYGMGGELYNEFSIAGDVAYLLDDRFTFGVSAEYCRLTVKNFSSYNNIFITLGSAVNISENIIAGISMNNLLRQSYSDEDNTIEQRALIGIALNADNNFIYEVCGIINLNRSSGFLFGIRKELFKALDIKFSVGTAPRSIEMSFDYLLYDYLSLNFNLFYDQNLGFNKRLYLYK